MTNDQIRALLDATTDGEWGVNECDVYSPADHEWICASREICRSLLERVDELEKRMDIYVTGDEWRLESVPCLCPDNVRKDGNILIGCPRHSPKW